MKSWPDGRFDIDAQVGKYGAVRPVYEAFAEALYEVLSRAAKDLGLLVIVQARAKELPSFAEKALRKRNKYVNPVWQLTDLCGARVITESKDDIGAVCEYIKRNFEIDEANSLDCFNRLATGEFGYRSVHFVVALKPGALEAELSELAEGRGDLFGSCLARLYERRTPEDAEKEDLSVGPRFKAEIQVRTLLQHAWAALGHDRVYKSGFEVPRDLQRGLNRIAAAMEDADEDFSRTIRGVDAYRNYFGAYMTRDQRAEEVAMLETVFRYDSTNVSLAQRIARLSSSIEDWAKVERALRPFVERWNGSDRAHRLKNAIGTLGQTPGADELEGAERTIAELRDPVMASVLHDYGLARWNQQQPDGQNYLDLAVHLDRNAVDARLALAETFQECDVDTALAHYATAYAIAPSDPHVLERFVCCKIMSDRSVDFVALIRPSIEAAITVCRERAAARVYLPRAYYDIGLFSLLLGRPYDALDAYAKGVFLTDSRETLTTVYDELFRLQRRLQGKLPELEWVMRFLLLVRCTRLLQMLKDVTSSPSERGRTDAESLQEELRALFSDFIRPLASVELPPVDDPVVIVAGACDGSIEPMRQAYRSVLVTAFRGFHGIVFSGGTTAGISGLVGDLPAPADGSFRKASYMPKGIPPWTEIHRAYCGQLRGTSGERFSALEPLQNWTDLLAAGVDPQRVRLLGISGGPIAAFEYRLALALGAKTAVLRDSGRAASGLANDPDWRSAPGLLLMPTDPQTVRAFVQDTPRATVLSDEDRERLARRAHELYRKIPLQQYKAMDPAMADWDELPPSLKSSNYAQVDHIEEKIRALGLVLRKCPPESVRLCVLDAAEVEVLAEIEHGRWNTERLLAGWALGDKDISKKRSPYLLAWSALPENIREYDRSAVRALPEMLKELGYEIVRPSGL